MVQLIIPPQGDVSDIERDFIDNEPPGLFNQGQDSLWGQVRKVFADYLQVVADQLGTWYYNLDPNTVDETDVASWEETYGIPIDNAKDIASRRALLGIRFEKGAFTRDRRDRIVQWFIDSGSNSNAIPIQLTPGGVPFDGGGLALSPEPASVAGGVPLDYYVAPIWLESESPGVLLTADGIDLSSDADATFTSSINEDTFGVALTPDGIPLSGSPQWNVLERASAFSYDVRILNGLAVDVAGLLRELERITPAPITATVTKTDALYG
jgi:hypothetical protein